MASEHTKVDPRSDNWEFNMHRNLRRRFGGSVQRFLAYCQEHKIDPSDLNYAYIQAGRKFIKLSHGGLVKRGRETAFHKLGR